MTTDTFAHLKNLLSFSARRKISRKGRAAKALFEIFEPRVLLSGTYLPGNITGTWVLGGLDKAGNLTSNGISAITAGSWTNQDGSPDTLVVAGTGSAYTVSTAGIVGMSLETTPTGSTVGSSTSLTGIISATRDVVALNETVAGAPTFDGLDVLVNNTGTFSTGDLAGTWNIAARDFRGTVTVNSSGQVTTGLLFLESDQKSAKILSGTATLNANGTGILALNTAYSGANSAFSTIALDITMNATQDTIVGNASNIGQPASAPQTGTVPAELTVMTKSAGTYASTDVRGVTWTINSALGDGTLTFNAGGTIAGTLNTVEGPVKTLTGNYTVGGNGTLIMNVTATNIGGGGVTHFSLSGAINQSRNLVALDRAIVNPGSNSGLTLLTSAANHAPTERATAVLAQTAFQSSSVTIDYPTLFADVSANDFDHDSLSFLITAVPASSGTLEITHNSVTSAVVPGVTAMVNGDTLTWTPASTAKTQADAFSIQATDGDTLSANATKIFINTGPLPLISATDKGNVLEARASSSGGDATITIQRSGGNIAEPSTITLTVAGSGANPAVQGVNYQLVAPAGVIATGLATASPVVVIPAGQTSVQLTVAPLDDGVADPTLNATVTVAPDPNGSSPSYTPSVHATAHVQVIDKSPLVTITARQPSIVEGNASVHAFIVTRLPAQGGNINSTQTVDLTYGGTFDTTDDLIAPPSVTFHPGDVKEVVILTTLDNHIANPTQTLTVTASGPGVFVTAPITASINVLDASPIITMTVNDANASEANPTGNPAKFTIHRTGSTASALVVDFTTASGGTFGTLGTNYSLSAGTVSGLTTSVTIPASQKSVTVTLTAIDDGMNDPALHPVITLAADSGPSYHLGSPDQATFKIINDDRRPLIANATVSQTTPMNTALSLTYSQLVTLTGASLAAGETNGTLRLVVTDKFQGTLQLIPSGGSATAAPVGTPIDAGDTLVWTPPAGKQGVSVHAFNLTAEDGTLTAVTKSKFTVAIT